MNNIRYADDLMIYANSAEELAVMVDLLCEELRRIGLHLNTAKTKVFTTTPLAGDHFLDMGGGMVLVCGEADFHFYLGKKMPGNLKRRWSTDISSRIQSAWARLHKLRHALTNRHVALSARMRLFSSVITPTLLFGLRTCPCTATQLNQIDVVQRKMLRLIVGWVRYDGEPWADTMRRMNNRVQSALNVLPVRDWSQLVLSQKF